MEMLLRSNWPKIFAGDLRQHYERQRGLHMQTFGQQLLIWWEPSTYLPTKKDQIGDLMAEGTIAIEVIGKLAMS